MSDAAEEQGTGESPSFPKAHVAASPWRFLDGAGLMWAIAGGCALLAIVLIWQARKPAGKEIVIHFEQGYGLAPGDPLRLRGIDVGEVESVTLGQELETVRVSARLSPESSGLAREGSRFWIERPQVQMGNVRGLDTLVGPKYIGVQPGDGAAQTEFQGVPSPRQFAGSEAIGVTISFRQGHGLTVGAQVRFRGTNVGEIVAIELDETLNHVLVHAELNRDAGRLAQEGAQFWIERAEVGMAQVRGLDTLIAGAYLAAAPGMMEGKEQLQFDGLETAPAEDLSSTGIEVVLESPARYGLKAGSPVLHRGVTIGKIVRVGLATDGATVEARALIYSVYQDLVRGNSRFWSNSGVGFEFGLLSGVQLDAESLETIAAGGAAMATPDSPGERIVTGHRFALAKQPKDDWLQWRPRIPIGRASLPSETQAPPPLRATLRWRRRSFGFMRDAQAQVWAHFAPTGEMLCPWQDDLPAELTVEYAGKTIDVPKARLKLRAGALVEIQGITTMSEHQWKKNQVRQPTHPENCVLMAGPDVLTVSAGRISQAEEPAQWELDPGVALTEDWNGASVVSQEDGKLIGVVHWNEARPYIAIWQP